MADAARDDEKDCWSIVLNDQEISLLLAALRNFQRQLVPLKIFEIARNGGRHPAPTDFDVDALCERLNCEGQRV